MPKTYRSQATVATNGQVRVRGKRSLLVLYLPKSQMKVNQVNQRGRVGMSPRPPRPGSGKGPFFAGWEQPFSDPGRTAPEIFRAIHTAIATDMTPFKAAFSSLTFMLLTSRQPTNKEPSPDSSRGPTCVVRTLFPRPPSNCPRDMSDHRLGKRCTEGHCYTAL